MLPVIKQPVKYRIFIANDFPIWFCSQTLHISKTNFEQQKTFSFSNKNNNISKFAI